MSADLLAKKPADEKFIYRDNSLTVKVSQGERLYLCGYCRLQVVSGEAFVNGARLRASETTFPFYSPKSSSLLYITPINCDAVDIALLELDNGPGIFMEGDPSIASLFSTPMGIKTPIPGIAVVSEKDLDCVPCDFPAEWISLASSLEEIIKPKQPGPIVFVIGPRKVGKSTMSRFICNSLWNQTQPVAFLDLDLGQTEFTPPGCISLKLLSKSPLLGPPFTHQSLTDGLVYLGFLSSADNPRFYLDGCNELIHKFLIQFQPQGIPLIVNTMGWVTGLGLSLLQHLLHRLPTSHIVAFPTADPNPYEYLSQALFEASPFGPKTAVYSAENAPNVAYVKPAEASGSASSRLLRYNPAELRSFTFWTYFLGKYSHSLDIMKYGSKLTFRSAQPFAVPINQIQLVFPFGEVMPKEMQLLALNLSVVGLARSSTPKKSPTCLALGLIRSIDLENRLYFVLSPISLESLRESQVNTFIVGKLQIPNTILSQPENANGPYLEYSGFMPNIGASTRKVRANIARKWNGA